MITIIKDFPIVHPTVNKIFVCSAILNILWLVPTRSENIVDINHGSNMLEKLKLKFPIHFSIIGKNGVITHITEKDKIGEYLTSTFSKKTSSGWINWAGRQPLKGFELRDGQCLFYEMLDLDPPRKGIEILLSKRLEDDDCKSERFWATLIFELCNALQADKFVKQMKAYKNDEIGGEVFSERMMRIEFMSAINAQKFQNQIWRPFAQKHFLNARVKKWFFPDGTTYDQWKINLSGTQEGRAYLKAYGKQERHPQKLDRQ